MYIHDIGKKIDFYNGDLLGNLSFLSDQAEIKFLSTYFVVWWIYKTITLKQEIRRLSPVRRRSAQSPGEKFYPEDEIFLAYINKRVGGFIFFHLKMVYLSDMYMSILVG